MKHANTLSEIDNQVKDLNGCFEEEAVADGSIHSVSLSALVALKENHIRLRSPHTYYLITSREVG